MQNASQNLYNGNIKAMITCLPQTSVHNASKTIIAEAFGNAYKYDQLNRLMSSRTFTNVNINLNHWQNNGIVNPQAYATDYTYDAMGNILTQKRNGAGVAGSPLALDDLTYHYQSNSNGLVSNKLYLVNDVVATGNYSDDIDDQGTYNNNSNTINTANNYGYDELGNLIRDNAEQIANIDWTVQGKIKKITRTGGSPKPMLEFGYDATGQRLWKKVTPASGGNVKTYYYLRDAQGNVMANYQQYTAIEEILFVATEHPMYGSSRIGVDNRQDTLFKNAVYNPTWYANNKNERNLGLKSFELSNHLGNVLVTVSDKKVNASVGPMGVNFEPEITTISDYYPFGSAMATRSYTASTKYRYGFNTQEKDDEVSGDNNSLNSEFRIYDSRLGRWHSHEPRFKEIIDLSGYVFCYNIPTFFIDKNGDLPIIPIILLCGFITMPNLAIAPTPNTDLKKIQATHQKLQLAWITTTFTLAAGASIKLSSYLGVYQSLHKALLFLQSNPALATSLGGTVCAIFDPNPANNYPGIGDEFIKGLRLSFKFQSKIVEFVAEAGSKFANAIEKKVVKKLLGEGKNVTLLKEVNMTNVKTADLLVNGIKTEIKHMILDKNTAGHLASAVKQVGEGGSIIWVRPKDSKVTLDAMKDFASKFTPQIDGKKVNVTIQVIDESTL